MIQSNLLIWFGQLFVTLLSIFILSGTINFSLAIYLTVLNYAILLVLSKKGKKNFINLSTIFVIGYGVFILGRFIGYVISPQDNLLNNLFCIDFFMNYCLSDANKIYLINFVNYTTLALGFGFIIKSDFLSYDRSISKIYDIKKLRLIILSCYVIFIIITYSLFTTLSDAILNGYAALYVGQAEEYQSPIVLILYSIYIASLALIYIGKGTNRYYNKHYKILIFLTILFNFAGILSGSRSSFITGLIIWLWVLYKNKKFTILHNIFFVIVGTILISSLNIIASLSGARALDTEGVNFQGKIAEAIFGQGISLMILDSALKIDNPPPLGYLKTLLPGIQLFFGYFDINYRHEFDWSSYLAYSNDRWLYEQGFGLGWSVFADFYYLALRFLPFYLLILIFWSYLLNFITNNSGQFKQGLAFIFMFYIFALSRANISTIIFTSVFYMIVFVCLKKRVL